MNVGNTRLRARTIVERALDHDANGWDASEWRDWGDMPFMIECDVECAVDVACADLPRTLLDYLHLGRADAGFYRLGGGPVFKYVGGVLYARPRRIGDAASLFPVASRP